MGSGITSTQQVFHSFLELKFTKSWKSVEPRFSAALASNYGRNSFGGLIEKSLPLTPLDKFRKKKILDNKLDAKTKSRNSSFKNGWPI